MKKSSNLAMILTIWIACSASVCAEIKPHALFTDNMVLQQGHEIPIWGTAEPGEPVSVTLGEETRTTTTGNNGRWMVRFPAIEEYGPIDLKITGENTIRIKNAIVGEVWVCSGQSNMAMSVARSNNADHEIASAQDRKIRLFTVPRRVSAEPQANVEGSWVECSPETIPNFSAVGYFFGRSLRKSVDRPVGLIQSAVGGTPAEAWTSDKKLRATKSLKPILDRWAEILTNRDKYEQQYQRQLANWEKAAQKARDAGNEPPRRPRPPLGPEHTGRASGLYNGMIQPLVPYAIRGAIWYQGEGNSKRAYQYRQLFPAMIQDWRAQWKQGDFPFLFVQLANYRGVQDDPGESDWAELREAQTMTLQEPNTGMAVIIDIGEADDIHPKNKQDVGRRLALAAQSVAYERDVVHSGPTMKSITIEKDTIRVNYKHTGSGLVAKGEKLKGFAVAGADRKFYWADAQIDGESVVVHSDKVSNPIAVRYAWADNPICNLYNQEGLPALPFRSDDWPGITVDSH